METPERINHTECAVLGAVLRDDSVMDEIATLLKPEDYRLDAHRKMWACMLEMYQSGQTITADTLADALHKRGQIEDIGGYGYFVQLFEGAGTSATAPRYAQIVREDSLLRHLAAAGDEIAHEARHPTDKADHILEAAETRILALGEMGSEGTTVSFREVVNEAIRRIEARFDGQRSISGIATGFEDLDMLTGGFQPAELTVLAARPGVGKTALSIQFAAYAAMQKGVPIFFASIEMRAVEVVERLLCGEAGVSAYRMRHGTLGNRDVDVLMEVVNKVGAAPVFIDDRANQSMLRIAANARRLKRKHGVGLIVIDYLQLIEPEDRRVPRYEQVGAISRRLKILARDLAVPVIALAQLNRETENRSGQKPRLCDLRESGSIEADADTVILMHRATAQNGDAEQTIELNIAKQRNGPVGEIVLRYYPDQLRFESVHDTPFEGRRGM
jgi:replicative DNA helicase